MADDQQLSITGSQPPLSDLQVTGSQAQPAPPRPTAPIGGAFPTELLAGMGEGALNTIQGVKNLINKYAGTSLPDVPGRTMPGEQEPLMRQAGKATEGVEEWLAGEEALKFAGGLVNVAQRFPQAIALMNKFPKAASILLEAAKQGTIGAAEGAVKSAAEGKDVAKGAALGGGLAAAGGGAGEALGVTGKYVMGKMFGSTPQEALTMAARPYVGEVNWQNAAQRGLPLLEAAAKKTPFKTVDELVNLTDQTRKDIWANEVEPFLQQHGKDVLDGNNVAKAVRAAKDPSWAMAPAMFKGKADAVEDVAKDFDNFNITVEQGNALLKAINAHLSDFYRLTKPDQAAELLQSPRVAAMEAAGDALREEIYRVSSPADPQAAQQFFESRQNYGAMKDLNRILTKRALVFNRQAPINLPQVLGGIEATAALLSGHPGAALAGAVPFAQRYLNSPGFLANRTLDLYRGPGMLEELAKRAAPTVGGMAGGAAGRLAAPEEGEEEPTP